MTPWCPGMAGHSQSTSLRSAQQESTKHHLKAPRRLGLLSPYKRVGQGSTTGRNNEEKQETIGKTQDRDRYLKQSPLSFFPLFETWARRPLSHACNPYTSTSVQGNTNFSPPLDVGPSFARTRINSCVFSLHHHPGKRHTAFTHWFRTPSGPNTDSWRARYGIAACQRRFLAFFPGWLTPNALFRWPR
jgi:hypothetical protein